jgi:hypothetical protein
MERFMSEQTVTYITSTESAIELRGKSYPVYTDFTDDHFMPFLLFRYARASQVPGNSKDRLVAEPIAVPDEMIDAVARLLKVIIIPDVPDSLIDLSRPSGFRIMLNYDEITEVFLKCLDIIKEKDPDQWGRLKDQDGSELLEKTTASIPDSDRIAALEKELAEAKKNEPQG